MIGKKKAKSIDADRSGTNIEADGESKGKSMSDMDRDWETDGIK